MGLHAYIDTNKATVTTEKFSRKNAGDGTSYSLRLEIGKANTEHCLYLDTTYGLYVEAFVHDDFEKAFLPEIINLSLFFTYRANFKEGVTREFGWYREGDAEAEVDEKYNDLYVEIKGKTLAGVQHLWDKMREGSILPYKLKVKTNERPAVEVGELAQAVTDLRKRLDWALDEISRADRIIASCNATQAEWERISRGREEFVAELETRKAKGSAKSTGIENTYP